MLLRLCGFVFAQGARLILALGPKKPISRHDVAAPAKVNPSPAQAERGLATVPVGEERIRQIAHRLWEEDGRPSGHEQRHWEAASQIFEAEQANLAAPANSNEQTSRAEDAAGKSQTPISERQTEDGMKSLDEIIADAQKATAQAVREAFDAGRSHTATELKNRMAALFEGLISSEVGAHHEPTPAPASHESPPADHGHG